MSNWNSIDRSTNEVDLISFNILHNHDSFFSQEMKRKLIGGILENTFLNKKNICSRCHNFLNHLSNNFSFFSHDTVHSLVIFDNDTIFNISFRSSDLELNHCNFSILNFGGASTSTAWFAFIKNYSFDKFSII